MPAIVDATIAQQTGINQRDLDLLLEALWKGTLHRQARGRGIQQPLFLLHIEYNDPFFRIGYLEDSLRLEPGPEEWRRGNRPTSLDGVKLDVTRLVDRVNIRFRGGAGALLDRSPVEVGRGAPVGEAGVVVREGDLQRDGG